MEKIEQTLDIREVAEMVGKRHDHLMRDIKKYIDEMAAPPNLGEGTESKIAHSDFFTESTYKDVNNQNRPCYQVTKKGCEFIAHKLTGVKGTEFTAKYINRFHDMESVIQQGIPQKQNADERLEIMKMNAQTRKAQTYLKLANVETLSSTYKNVLVSKACEVLAGEQIIPLPVVEQRKVYSAGELGEMLGVSANKIGRIANQNNLKVPEYGEYRRDKSKYSAHECDTWVYFESVIPEFKRQLKIIKE